jgi:hypothetical protein
MQLHGNMLFQKKRVQKKTGISGGCFRSYFWKAFPLHLNNAERCDPELFVSRLHYYVAFYEFA